MLLYEKIITEEERLVSLKGLVETYKTIAISTSRRIRASVLANRVYHLGLNRWFGLAKDAYERETRKAGAKKDQSFIKRNGKTAFLLLSANTGLYGDILDNIFKSFTKELNRADKGMLPDIVISGRIGVRFFEEHFPGRKFTFFDLPDQVIPKASLRELTEFLHKYERVVVFHGKFKNIIMQEPAVSNITGNLPTLSEDVSSVRFLFEPSLEEVARFFETEIFASLLEQSCSESRLAKVTSRMLLLDQADQNIELAAKNVRTQKIQLRHQTENKKQVNSIYASMNFQSRNFLSYESAR